MNVNFPLCPTSYFDVVAACPVGGDRVMEGESMNGNRILGWVLRQTDEQRLSERRGLQKRMTENEC